MLVIPNGSSSALRGDLIVKAVLRSDLVPIPLTVELEVREVRDTDGLREGATMKVGRDQAEVVIVKSEPGGDSGKTQGERSIKTRRLTALLASCADVARPLQRAVIRRNATLGEIYRACGARVRIESDFAVPEFVCMVGMTPTFEIAKALQEEAGALVLAGQRVTFLRLAEMFDQDAAVTLREDSAQAVQSTFLEGHLLPVGFTTGAEGEVLRARGGGRGVLFRPRADARILNNLGTALVTRRKMQAAYAPHLLAGMRVDIAGAKFVIVTAAHAFEPGGDDGPGQQVTRLWLGQLVRP